MTKVINLVAGPGSGKSTTAAGIFYELKRQDINAELATEYAKDVVWEKSTAKLGNQVYIMAKQHHRLWRLKDQVDVIVTDCPLFLSLYYGKKQSQNFEALALELFHDFDNEVFFIGRQKKYNPMGRIQTEEKAKEIDVELLELLKKHDITYDFIPGDEFAAKEITNRVIERLNE